MSENASPVSESKQTLLSWSRFYRLLIFFAILLPLCYFFMEFFRALVVPFFLSLFFAYILSPLVNFFDRYLIPRVLIVTCIILFTFGVVGFALFQVLPHLYVEVLNLIKLAPKVFDFVNDRLFPVIKEWLIGLGFFDEQTIGYLVDQAQAMVQWTDRIQDALTSIWRSAPHVVGTLINLVMTPLFTFFFVKDQKKIIRFFTELIPVDLREPVSSIFCRIGNTLHSVIKGQILVAAILAILYAIGFSFVGVNAGFSIGLLAGLCRLIPYLDVVVGSLLCLIVILANWQGFGQIFMVAGVITLVQTLDGMLITPRIIGERLGIHPLLVITTVIGFADMWGFWGVLFAVPAIAVIKVIFILLRPYYENSRAFGLIQRDKK